MDVEFLVDVLHMLPNRVFGYEEPLCDARARMTLSKIYEHFGLARRKLMRCSNAGAPIFERLPFLNGLPLSHFRIGDVRFRNTNRCFT